MQYPTLELSPTPPVRPALSLKRVAEKVVGYFNTTTSTIFDINDVASTLNIPKRRLYDVLNIMAPLGIVERNGRGKYIWTGTMQPSLCQTQKEKQSEKLHVRDLSSKFLAFVKNTEKNTISLTTICESVFQDKNGQLRRLYDILAVFEVLNLIKRQPKSGDFLVLPLFRNMFITKMLPPKKRAALALIPCNRMENSPEMKQNLMVISPPPPIAKIQNGQLWLGASAFR
jgi:hypothetical protein